MDPAQRVSQLLVFAVGGHRFALGVSAVREVVRAVAVAALPKAPAIVEGVVNVRGALVPVLDIRTRFSLPSRAVWPDQHFIVASAGARVVALRVDRALDVVSVPAEALESASRVVPGIEYVVGLARLPDGVLVIHDLESFLALEEARQLDSALGEGSLGAGGSARSGGWVPA
ncbi:MAG: chemotaxis protein CheW [Gemmatimonadetes bacterium]|nr:chemotaxis protein CheW [Gemmatimonadota bacterium]